MTLINGYRSQCNRLNLKFMRFNEFMKNAGIAANEKKDITLNCSCDFIQSNSCDTCPRMPFSIPKTNPVEKIVNIVDDAIITCCERASSNANEGNLKILITENIFNNGNGVSLRQKLMRKKHGIKELFNFGSRLHDSWMNFTSRQFSNHVLFHDKLETKLSDLHSTEELCNHGDKVEDSNSENNINRYTTRTHTCGELRASDLNKEVTLCGWVKFIRMDKFILLRDAYGTTQVLIRNPVDLDLNSANLPLESVIRVTGTVVARPKSQINTKLSTGEIEVDAKAIQILNKALPKMPFIIRDYNKATPKILNRYRFLALRYPELQNNLRLRSKMLLQMRNFLITQRNFVEVETPTLFKKTPGGSQEFIVPTQYKNRFYSLVQSPQQLKQLLMVGSLDRYFQIARCYRDEKTNPERQPEFTQLDIELSFTTIEDIMRLTEEILIASWPSSKPSISVPFPKILYKDAIEKYGSDKPCLLDRFLIRNLEDCVQKSTERFIFMLSIPQAQDSFKQLRQRIDKLESFESVKIYLIKVINIEETIHNLEKILPTFDKEIFKNSVTLNPGDIVILSTGANKENALKALGSCRHEIINHLNLFGKQAGELIYDFTWVVDFPLLEKNELGELKSAHHPFTHPHLEDLHLIPNDVMNVRSLAYDLVLNGSEIGGGSIRIHDAELQKTIFKILNLEEKDFSHLLEALQMGCPPHGGIALGLDRLFAIICCTESIKDVIAFPKGWQGQDLMTGCPNDIPISDKKRYHIFTDDQKYLK